VAPAAAAAASLIAHIIQNVSVVKASYASFGTRPICSRIFRRLVARDVILTSNEFDRRNSTVVSKVIRRLSFRSGYLIAVFPAR